MDLFLHCRFRDRKNKEPQRNRLSSQSKDERNFKNSYEDKYIRDINKDSRELRDYKNSRGNFESKDPRYKDSRDSRDYGKDSRDYTKDSRDYRREKSHRSDSRSSRDSYDSRDSPRSSSSKDYRDRESKYDSKYRSPISSKGNFIIIHSLDIAKHESSPCFLLIFPALALTLVWILIECFLTQCNQLLVNY